MRAYDDDGTQKELLIQFTAQSEIIKAIENIIEPSMREHLDANYALDLIEAKIQELNETTSIKNTEVKKKL